MLALAPIARAQVPAAPNVTLQRSDSRLNFTYSTQAGSSISVQVNANSTFTGTNTTIALDPARTFYSFPTDTSWPYCQPIYWRASARNASGTGPYTAAKFEACPCAGLPPAPTNLAVTRTNGDAACSYGLDFSWTPVTQSGCTISYRILNGAQQVNPTPLTGSPYHAAHFTGGTFTVKAKNVNGESGASNAVALTCGAAATATPVPAAGTSTAISPGTTGTCNGSPYYGLRANQLLLPKQYLSSPNKVYKLMLLDNGSLGLYSSSPSPIWTVGSTTKGPGSAGMTLPGNFVVKDAVGGFAYQSGTTSTNAFLALHDTGQINIYAAGSCTLVKQLR